MLNVGLKGLKMEDWQGERVVFRFVISLKMTLQLGDAKNIQSGKFHIVLCLSWEVEFL